MRFRYLDRLLVIAFASALAGCLGSSDDSGSATTGPSKGTLSIGNKSPVNVAKGSYTDVKVKLEGSTGVSGQIFHFATADRSVSEVTPKTCSLSSAPDAGNTCVVRVHGHSLGTTSLVAMSTGYDPQSVKAVVSAGPQVDTLMVYNNTGAGNGTYTSGSANVSYATTGIGANQVTLTGQIAGLSGVDGVTTTAFVTFALSGTGAATGLPTQCAVTTATPSCSVTFTATGSGSFSVTTGVAGSFLANISAGNLPTPVNVSISPSTTPSPPPSGTNGTITLASNLNNVVNVGVKAPLFVNWAGATTVDTVTLKASSLKITYTGTNTVPIQFYSFAAGNNTAMITGSNAPTDCALSYTGSTSGSTLSCGYGLVVMPNAVVGDSVTITAAPVTTKVGTYTIAPLTLTVAAAEAAARSITFTNNSSNNVWVGITGGGGWSYVSPTATTIPPGTPASNIKPGAGSACGPSNPAAACPSGTTCIQGGANPQSDIGATPFYCYYDQGLPASGLKLAPSASTTLSISASSMSPNGMYWSGNFFARANCDSGSCNLNCNANNDGGACGPATGVNPGIATLAELTFVKSTAGGPDYYDVSIINGANFAVEFGPDPGSFASAPSGNGYNCGIAGARTAGAANFAASSLTNLPNASWAFAPTASNYPTGVTAPTSPKSPYRYVIPGTSSKSTCSATSDCTPNVATDVCGYASASVIGGTPDYTLRCGTPVSWMTADSIWGFNQNKNGTNNAPFAFGVSDSAPTSNWTATAQGTTNVGNYQLCNNNTYSSYQPQGTNPTLLACGGVMWGNTQPTPPTGAPSGLAGLQITHVANTALTASTNWLNYVLPTITWLKSACPTCYTYPFDDKGSTFTCGDSGGSSPVPANAGVINYNVKFYDLSF